MSFYKLVTNYLKEHKTIILHIIVSLALVAISALIFALRYQPAFQTPNFYAEDGSVFVNHVIHKDFIASTLSGFNGYLVAGEYLLAELAVGLHTLSGLPFYELPKIIAIVSCAFLGATVSLPYILFRKQLGVTLAVATVIVSAFVPMPAYDYAIIGTLGNLKFAFLYWAFLLILYRPRIINNTKKLVVVDLLLLLCVLTNVLTVLLLPLILFSYKKEGGALLRLKKMKSVLSPHLIGLFILAVISFLYLLVIYFKQIPKLPGYLDTPYQLAATPKILYRVTLYSWLHPVTSTFRDVLTIGLLLLFSVYSLLNRADRKVFLIGSWTILVATLGFVINRPGISDFFVKYSSSPDQFFYAQSLIFIFMSSWLLRKYFKNSLKHNLLLIFITFLYLWWAAPYSSSFGRNQAIYANIGTAQQNLSAACSKPGENIIFIIYPSVQWNWTVPRSIACN